MSTEIQITITPDPDILPPGEIDAAMARTLRLLSGEADVPTRKLSVSVKCADDDAGRFKDAIHAALSGRPMGIEVKLRTVCEEYVERKTLPRVTPMDREWQDFADKNNTSITGTLFGRPMNFEPSDEAVSSDAPPR